MLYNTSLRRGTCASLSRRQRAKSGTVTNLPGGCLSRKKKKYFCVNTSLFKLIFFCLMSLSCCSLFEKVCENRIRRRKEIQQKGRGFEDEGLRARKKEGAREWNPKENSLLRVIGRNQPLNQNKTPLSAAVSGERTKRTTIADKIERGKKNSRSLRRSLEQRGVSQDN